jgi:phytoene dehydrogenase-like protein
VTLDAIVVGAGPNGLAAAITLARAGKSVRLYEAAPTVGGSTRSAALTEPGFTHDVCAAVHALALSSPLLRSLPLAQHGLELVHPPSPFAHPMDDGTAVVVHRSIAETCDALSARDAKSYRALTEPFVERSDDLMNALLGPLGMRHPILMARFGRYAGQSAAGLARRMFDDERTRALFAGLAAHSLVPLEYLATSGYALGLLIAAHAVGWPVARGGSQALADSMASYFRSLGGEIITDHPVESLAALPASRAVLLDVTPQQFLRIAGDKLPSRFQKRLSRYRYGPGVFKMDWALNAPVPWRAKSCAQVATLHLGGTMAEIAAGEQASWNGHTHDRPYVLVVQPSLFDATRAPAGKHTLWAYCHVPNGSTVDMRERIEAQIERYAPGFRDCIIARSALSPADLEQRNANLVGGDIAGGAADLAQIFARPTSIVHPYAMPVKDVYLCSSSTPPGVGVHGMCGFNAAKLALRKSLAR